MPLVNLHGVYILPGIPRLFKSMVDAHKDRFKGPANKSRTLYTNTVEGDLAGGFLNAVFSGQARSGYACLPVTPASVCEGGYEILKTFQRYGRQQLLGSR